MPTIIDTNNTQTNGTDYYKEFRNTLQKAIKNRFDQFQYDSEKTSKEIKNPYIAVQDNTSVSKKLPIVKKQQINNTVISSDNRTPQERAVSEKYFNDIMYPSFGQQVGDAAQKPLR